MGRKKQKNMVIRKTVNLTDQMRKERQTEVFEEMNTAVSKETISTESIRQKKKLSSKREIKIQKEQVIRFESDLPSIYEKSNDTHSLDTISEPGNIDEFQKDIHESIVIPPQRIPMKFVTTNVDTPVQAVFISDYELCQVMHTPRPNSSQTTKVEFSKRFEVEQKFLEEMISDVEKLLVSSGRMDVELKVVKTREKNGTPCCKISLIRKMKLEQPPKKYGIFGCDPMEVQTKDEKFRANHSEGITKTLQIPLASRIINLIRSRLGF